MLRATEVANFVDMIGIHKKLVYISGNAHTIQLDLQCSCGAKVGVITWTNGDVIKVVSVADILLDNFRDYRPRD